MLRQLHTSASNEVDVLGWMGRAALELMGTGGLGCSFDPLVEDVPNPYAEAIKSLGYVDFFLLLPVSYLSLIVISVQSCCSSRHCLAAAGPILPTISHFERSLPCLQALS